MGASIFDVVAANLRQFDNLEADLFDAIVLGDITYARTQEVLYFENSELQIKDQARMSLIVEDLVTRKNIDMLGKTVLVKNTVERGYYIVDILY